MESIWFTWAMACGGIKKRDLEAAWILADKQVRLGSMGLLPYSLQELKRVWRSLRRKSRSVPESGANFLGAISVPAKLENPGKNSVSQSRNSWEELSWIVKFA